MKKIINTDDIAILELGTPLPKSSSYTPILNTDLHGLVIENTLKAGLRLIDYNFKSTTNGNVVIGTYRFESDYPDLNMMIAWRNSYDKSKSAAIVSGSSVWICENGCVFGEEQFVKKHMGKVDEMILPILQNQIITVQRDLYKSHKFSMDLKGIHETPEYNFGLLGQLYFEEIISPTQLSLTKSEYENPTFNYGVSKDNLWNIYNLCTLSLKQEHPSSYFEKHLRLQEFFEGQITFLNGN